jgi:hypothetical protein
MPRGHLSGFCLVAGALVVCFLLAADWACTMLYQAWSERLQCCNSHLKSRDIPRQSLHA